MEGQRKRVKNYNRYPNGLKRKIARLYLSGEASYAVLAEEHGLRDRTVAKEFVKWYRRKLSEEPNFEEQPERPEKENVLSEKELKARVKELEKQLRQAELKTEVLETMIDIAEEKFNLAIRKKSGTNQSKR